ncbi:MAG: signal recognition particle protein [Spirochaetaceae bacterium]|jgi:signal recognition particle subunit SRP54|nr:signal recognition particle protein [Spirochaetaceae bacterium]
MLDKLTGKIQDAFKFIAGKSSISEKNIADAVEVIKTALLEADVNLRVVRRFVNSTIEEAKGESVLRSVDPGQQFVKIVHDKIAAMLGGEKDDLSLKVKGPDTLSVILMLGLQGSGKTTSSAKLAFRLKKEGRKPLLVACDLVRPAAIEQLSVLGAQNALPVYREDGAKDSAAVYKNAAAFARKNMLDTLIIDTTGRLQIDEVMMDELSRLKKASEPDELLLVSDSMTGQTSVEIAKAFDEKIGLTGVVLTKFDSDTRGGAALSLKTVTGKSVKFIGTGEKIEDFEVFHPKRFTSRLLGMGDVVGLVEKAQELVDEKEALDMQKKMASDRFTLEDYLAQLRMMKRMGPMSQVLQMIPGAAGNVTEEDMEKAQFKLHEVIICSMTRKERENYHIVGPSRRKRIAKGSGTTTMDVERLIKNFEKLKKKLKKMAKWSMKGAGERR